MYSTLQKNIISLLTAVALFVCASANAQSSTGQTHTVTLVLIKPAVINFSEVTATQNTAATQNINSSYNALPGNSTRGFHVIVSNIVDAGTPATNSQPNTVQKNLAANTRVNKNEANGITVNRFYTTTYL